MAAPKQGSRYFNRLGLLREKLDLRQHHVADLTGIDTSQISKMESGRIGIAHARIAVLAKALRVVPGQLFSPMREHEDPLAARAIGLLDQMTPLQRHSWLDVGQSIVRATAPQGEGNDDGQVPTETTAAE